MADWSLFRVCNLVTQCFEFTLEKILHSKAAPYETSLLSEYTRLLLILFAFPLMMLFAYFSAYHRTGILCLIATTILMLSLVCTKGHHVLRICLLGAMTMNVFALAMNPIVLLGSRTISPPRAATYLLLIALAIASLFEISAWLKSSARETLMKTLAWGTLAIPAIVYIIVIPSFDLLWVTIEGDEKKLALRDPNWKLVNEATFRAAKFAVFAVFTYVGACLGSFLNVVAYCVPRGEAIGLRDSKCPRCENKISRIDNLPLFSFINLGARCRNCRQTIPIRYLVVELVVAAVFGSLFLYELVAGCPNVPLIKVSHEGILWIILYPKWPAIAIYCFHTLFMSTVLVLALIEWDQQLLPSRFAAVITIGLFCSAAIYHPIQPVPLLEHVPGISLPLPLWLDQLIKLFVGGIAGAAIGGAFRVKFSTKHQSSLTMAFMLTGLVLGWQALLQVTLFFGILLTIMRCTNASARRLLARPTTILFIAIVIHHPFWKTIADLWRFL